MSSMKRLISSAHRVQSQKGVSLVEIMLTVGLIMTVMIFTSNILANSLRSTTRNAQKQKVSKLAEMVFEQYGAFSAHEFGKLASRNVTNAIPMVFFHTSDNLGFDGYAITTSAAYSGPNNGLCDITLDIAWLQDGDARTERFVRRYSESNEIYTGAAAEVYVKIPCNGLTDTQEIIATCPGISSMTVMALGASGSPVTGLTDHTGRLLLSQLAPITANPIVVSAPAYSSYTIRMSDPNYAPLFFARTKPEINFVDGQPITSISTTVALSPSVPNTLLFTDFHQASRITGRVINDSDPADVAGKDVSIGETNAAFVGSIDQCYSSNMSIGNCVVKTDAFGNYEFNNITTWQATSADAYFKLVTLNTRGSRPDIQPGNPLFAYGQIGSVESVSSLMTHPYPPEFVQDVHMKLRGWVRFDLSVSGAPFPGGVLKIQNSSADDGWGSRFPRDFGITPLDTISLTADASGVVRAYNLREKCTVNVYDPIDLDHPSNWVLWECVSGDCFRENPVAVEMNAFALNGTVVDLRFPPRLLGRAIIKVQGERDVATTTEWIHYSSATVNDDGTSISVQGIDPGLSQSGPTFNVTVSLSTTSFSFPGITVSGNITDVDTGEPAVHASVRLNSNGPVPPFWNLKTDTSGHYDFGPKTIYWKTPSAGYQISCDVVTRLCSFSAPTANYQVDTSQTSVLLEQDLSVSAGYRVIENNGTVSETSSAVNINAQAKLKTYQVIGTVRDKITGGVLPDVSVEDGAGDSNLSSVSGTFSLWARVEGRTTGEPGTVTVRVGNQVVNGVSYTGAEYVLPIPSPADPDVPLTQDFLLQRPFSSSI